MSLPICTLAWANIFSSSYHMPGMGLRKASFSVAANMRKGTSGNYGPIGQSRERLASDATHSSCN